MNEICKIKLPQRRPQQHLGQSVERVALQKRKPQAEPTENLAAGQKLIPLTQGKFAIVDSEDFEFLSRWKWYAYKSTAGTFYAGRSNRINKKTQTILPMHRAIMNLSETKIHVDHKNGNGLDNRRCNLRPLHCSKNQLGFLTKRKKAKSKYRGVTWGGWLATICKSGKRFYIGQFSTEIEAAMAYDKKAVELGFFNEALNFPK